MSDLPSQQPINWQQNAEIAVPSPKRERRLAIREVDWNRLKRAVEKIQKPVSAFSMVSSAIGGASLSAGTAIIPLKYSTGLPEWVVPLYVWFTIFGLLFAVTIFWLDQSNQKRLKEDALNISLDMADIERLFPKDESTTDD